MSAVLAFKQEKGESSVLDASEQTKSVDLLSFIADDHLIKQLSKGIASTYHLPESTVFMMGISIFSSMACRKYCVNYADGSSLPIGLYVIAEQPSGVGKSRCLGFFQKPFYEIHKGLAQDRTKQLNYLLGIEETSELSDAEHQELYELKNNMMPNLCTTNATPAGLELTLASNYGFFAAISSEQGLFNSLFNSKSNGGVVNNDVVLNGFDGGFVNVSRAGREGYSGHITGSVTCFAQQGSIETILEASQGSGLSERFLMLVEPHMLGKRDHTLEQSINNEITIKYEITCDFAVDLLKEPRLYDDLSHLFINKEGFKLIAEYKNEIEPFLADGGKYSFTALRGVASKINIQVMKIAANLHLLDNGFWKPEIELKHVKSAIQIADKLLQHQRQLLIDKGIIGLKAEYQTMLRFFEFRDTKLTLRMIQQKCRNVKPFKDMPKASQAIKGCLAEMVKDDLLIKFEEKSETGKPVEVFKLAQ